MTPDFIERRTAAELKILGQRACYRGLVSERGACLWCDEPVLDEEPAEATVLVTAEGPVPRWHHWECAARLALGSVGHQRRLCSCFGGAEEDPTGLSRREAAAAAFALAQGRTPS